MFSIIRKSQKSSPHLHNGILEFSLYYPPDTQTLQGQRLFRWQRTMYPLRLKFKKGLFGQQEPPPSTAALLGQHIEGT